MTCQAIKENQSTCRAHAMHGSDFCYLHNPDVPKEEKREAQAKGGANTRIIQEPLSAVSVGNVSDVVSLLGGAINEVRSGLLDIKVANCLGYLAGHLTKAIELSELEKRLEKLEAAVKNK